jgi:MFS family permease
MAIGFGAVSGQLIGGVLIKLDLAGLGWRPTFLINVPVGAASAPAPRLARAWPASPGRGPPPGSTSSAPRWSRPTAIAPPLVEGNGAGWLIPALVIPGMGFVIAPMPSIVLAKVKQEHAVAALVQLFPRSS